MSTRHIYELKRQLAAIGIVSSSLFLFAGCAAERPHLVPDSAVMKAQGNDRVVYTAERAGNVWIADKDANAIVYSGRLNSGDRLVLDTKENLVTVNDRAVVTKQLQRRDYKIYFEPGLAVPAAARVSRDERRSEISRPSAVPSSASLVAEGRNRTEYTAADDGEVWIANADRNSLVYTGRIERGEHVVIDPDRKDLTINGRTVWSERRDLPADNYRVFFAPSDARRPILTPTPGSVTSNGAAPVVVVERPREIPAAATVRSEFEDRTEIQANDAGTAWVVDGSNRVVYSTRLREGDRLTVDPANDQIQLNDHRAYDGRLTPGHYRLYFERAR
jgi:hypothetical protein